MDEDASVANDYFLDDEVKDDDVEDDKVDDDDDYFETDDVEEADRPQNQDSRFVKAFAVAMRMRISQEPPCDEFTGRMPRASQIRRQGHTLGAGLRSRHALGHLTGPIHCM